MKYINRRLALLVDEVNAYREARDLFDAVKLDIESMLRRLQHYTIIRTILYCVKQSGPEPVGFKHKMSQLGVDVRLKAIRVFANGQRKANWDVELTLDAIEMLDRVDAICLCSHDTDFIPLMIYLRQHGVKVLLMAFAESVAPRLVEAADEFVPIRHDMLRQLGNGYASRTNNVSAGS